MRCLGYSKYARTVCDTFKNTYSSSYNQMLPQTPCFWCAYLLCVCMKETWQLKELAYKVWWTAQWFGWKDDIEKFEDIRQFFNVRKLRKIWRRKNCRIQFQPATKLAYDTWVESVDNFAAKTLLLIDMWKYVVPLKSKNGIQAEKMLLKQFVTIYTY